MRLPPGSSERPITVVLQNQVTHVEVFGLSTRASRCYLEWTQGGVAFFNKLQIIMVPLDQK